MILYKINNIIVMQNKYQMRTYIPNKITKNTHLNNIIQHNNN